MVDYFQEGLVYLTTNPVQAALNADSFFNKIFATLGTAATYKVYNITSPGVTSWVSYAAIKTSCEAVIGKVVKDSELWIEIGGNKIIGLTAAQSLFGYNTQTNECLLRF